MGVKISYMGTKSRLARVVSEIVDDLPSGPLLDAFSGMCAVGESIAPKRQIWSNDVQCFPALVAKALFCSARGPVPSTEAKRILEPAFRKNADALFERFRKQLDAESNCLATRLYGDLVAVSSNLPYVGNDNALESERGQLANQSCSFPYRLATITYAGSFFGVRQCIELDSIRYSIDNALAKGQINREQKDWFLIALGQVLSRVNNSTGQFANYFKPSKTNAPVIFEKRRRSIWEEFFPALESIGPAGSAQWRSANRAFHDDALSLLDELCNARKRPSIVYADPPYSSAQYSRYYHVLDVLVAYDYPRVTGNGRYPERRFQTSFSHVRGVAEAIRLLVEHVCAMGACLVLSYPDNGLFCRHGGSVIRLLKRHFRNANVAYSGRHRHSTFGGPLAPPTIQVLEKVYVAYN